jgi:hypothetical protein
MGAGGATETLVPRDAGQPTEYTLPVDQTEDLGFQIPSYFAVSALEGKPHGDTPGFPMGGARSDQYQDDQGDHKTAKEPLRDAPKAIED